MVVCGGCTAPSSFFPCHLSDALKFAPPSFRFHLNFSPSPGLSQASRYSNITCQRPQPSSCNKNLGLVLCIRFALALPALPFHFFPFFASPRLASFPSVSTPPTLLSLRLPSFYPFHKPQVPSPVQTPQGPHPEKTRQTPRPDSIQFSATQPGFCDKERQSTAAPSIPSPLSLQIQYRSIGTTLKAVSPPVFFPILCGRVRGNTRGLVDIRETPRLRRHGRHHRPTRPDLAHRA